MEPEIVITNILLLYDYGKMISSGGVSLRSWQVCSQCDDPYLVYIMLCIVTILYLVYYIIALCNVVQVSPTGLSWSIWFVQSLSYSSMSAIRVGQSSLSLSFLSVSVHLCCVYISRYSHDSCL